MEALRTWLRQICCYLILSTLIEQFVPKKEYERLIHLFLNLLLILLLVQPIAGKSLQVLEQRILAVSAAVFLPEDSERQLQELTEYQDRLERNSIDAVLQEEAASFLDEEGYELSDSSVQYGSDGIPREILLYVKRTGQADEFYGITQEDRKTIADTLAEQIQSRLQTACRISVRIL